jgi:polyhydroxybutyrate depolymerase
VSGTADPISPWAGGRVETPGGGSPGRVISAEATAARFAALAGAAADATVVRHPDTRPDDGTRVETRRWRAGDGGEVVLMAVRGGGHSLPHPSAPFPAEIVGRTSRDLDAADLIWRFFARHMGAGNPPPARAVPGAP